MFQGRGPTRLSAGFPAQYFLLDLLQAGVAYVAALDEIDDVLADVAGMIADAFQRPRRPDAVEHARDGARVFHHVGDELADGALVFLVHLAVLARGAQRRLDIHAREGIERVVYHL